VTAAAAAAAAADIHIVSYLPDTDAVLSLEGSYEV
jgi:hypothetical protein